jgi:hypothetical protein
MNRWPIYVLVCTLFLLCGSLQAEQSGKKNLTCTATDNPNGIMTFVIDYDHKTVTDVGSGTFDATFTDTNILWTEHGSDYDLTRASGVLHIHWRRGVSGPTQYTCKAGEPVA